MGRTSGDRRSDLRPGSLFEITGGGGGCCLQWAGQGRVGAEVIGRLNGGALDGNKGLGFIEHCVRTTFTQLL